MGDETNEYTDQMRSTSFLNSFNIDTDNEPAPHYIVNLDSFQPAPDGTSEPELPKPTDTPETLPGSAAIPIPTLPTYVPFVSIGAKSRVRGSYKPLNEMVETRIRTYEGADSHTKIATLQQHFPTFKKGMIDRCFTKNLLNFEKAYTELFMLQKQQQEDRSKIKLILTPKVEKNKHPRVIPNIKSPELINSPHIRGRPSRKAENKYYRRVIVGKDGSVAPADITEKNFIRAADSLRAPGYMAARPPNRPLISYPGLPLGERANYLNEPPEVPETDTKKPFLGTIRPNYAEQLPAVAPTSQQPNQDQDATESTPANNDGGTTSAAPNPNNKFFRSNRLSGTELKKRTYLTKELQAPTQGRTRSLAISKMEPDSGEPSDSSAANFMAGVGVVSTPANRGRRRGGGGGRRRVKGRAQADNWQEVIEQQESDEEANDGFDLSKEERKRLMEFFNEAPARELTLMPGCSQKTAEVIINMRPFKNTVDLKLRLDATRYLSTNLVDACKELMEARSMFSSLLNSCEAIADRVSTRLGALLTDSINLPVPHTVEGDTENDYVRTKKTSFLNEQPVILHPLRQLKPYQLVGLNWLRILHEEKVNGILSDEMGLGKTVQAIAFLAYLYENGERGPHLIMCPPSTLENWKRELHNWCAALKVLVYQGAADVRKAIRLKIYESGSTPDFNVLLTSYSTGTSTLEDRALMKRVDFHYGIFDEAHMLKNVTTQRYKTLSSFQIQRRILLTGTPLQNNLMELISLLAFVMPDLFSSNTDHLKRVFQLLGKSVTDDNETSSGDSEKKEGALENGSSSSRQELVENTGSNILIPNRSQFEREILDKARRLLQPFCLRRLKVQVLAQLPPKTEETMHINFTEGQRTSYINLIHRFRNAQGSSTNDEDQLYDDEDEALRTSNLLNQVGLSGKRNGEPPRKKGKIIQAVESRSPTNNDPSLTPFNMLMQLRKASNHQLLLSGIAYTEENLKELAVVLHTDPSHMDADPALILEDLRALSDHQVHKVCRLYDVLSPFSLPPEALIEGSGKIKWLEENLPKMLKEGHRILIFSQFVIMLDILGEYLLNRGFKFLRFDGSTPVTDRQTLIDTFNNDETYEIFLLSTKAGGLGITLTGADIVIIHDIDFNPYNDRQAADRCHRVGQTKPVRVIRLVSSASLEECIWRSAEEKLRLEEDVVAESAVPEVQLTAATAGGKRVAVNGLSSSLVGENSDNDHLAFTSSTSASKRILQGEIIKFLSDALTMEGEQQIGSPRCN